MHILFFPFSLWFSHNPAFCSQQAQGAAASRP